MRGLTRDGFHQQIRGLTDLPVDVTLFALRPHGSPGMAVSVLSASSRLTRSSVSETSRRCSRPVAQRVANSSTTQTRPLPSTLTPTPMLLNAGSRMLARWSGEFMKYP